MRHSSKDYWHLKKCVVKSILSSIVIAYLSWSYIYLFWVGREPNIPIVSGTFIEPIMLAPFLLVHVFLFFIPIITFFYIYQKG